MTQQVCVLGATGSIGVSTLDVISRHPDRFSAYALTAYANVDDMLTLCRQHHPRFVVMVDEDAASRLAKACSAEGMDIEVLSGEAALCEVASKRDVDVVMAAIVGAAGLSPNLSAIHAGKRVLLANKESLVMSGELFMSQAAQSGSVLMPIDSEHNAIYQALPDQYRCGDALPKSVRRLLLTASGGPFRKHSRSDLLDVSPEDACRHPNWSMGRKISVDSASLMNKGLELIEACWLFSVQPEQVDVHIHPESVIHSMVEYSDGSVMAQMGNPDMRTPIAYGLAWPERMDAGVSSLNLFEVAQLNFERPDLERFPCLRIAQEAFRAGGTSCAIMNAANEVAVEAFLKGNIGFLAIPDIIEAALSRVTSRTASSIETVIEADLHARQVAQELVLQRRPH